MYFINVIEKMNELGERRRTVGTATSVMSATVSGAAPTSGYGRRGLAFKRDPTSG